MKPPSPPSYLRQSWHPTLKRGGGVKTLHGDCWLTWDGSNPTESDLLPVCSIFLALELRNEETYPDNLISERWCQQTPSSQSVQSTLKLNKKQEDYNWKRASMLFTIASTLNFFKEGRMKQLVSHIQDVILRKLATLAPDCSFSKTEVTSDASSESDCGPWKASKEELCLHFRSLDGKQQCLPCLSGEGESISGRWYFPS